MFRCDRRCDGCDGKFGNFVGTKHTQRKFSEVVYCGETAPQLTPCQLQNWRYVLPHEDNKAPTGSDIQDLKH